MVANTGTYLDSPFHRFADGNDLSELPLARLADLEALVVSAPASRAVGVEAFAGLEVAGRAVLVHTGWARHWRTDQYFEGHPFLTADGRRLSARRRRGAGGYRLAQHRRHRRRVAAGAHHALAGRHPHRGAPDRPGAAPANRQPLLRRAGQSARVRDVSRARLRPARLASLRAALICGQAARKRAATTPWARRAGSGQPPGTATRIR